MSRHDVLVDAAWVEARIDDPSIVLIEVDEDITSYEAGHIPGAVRIEWRGDLQDPIRRDFISKEQFESLLSRKGIGNDHTVVLYGGDNNWFAAYAFWYFKLYGHRDVRLLDGGRKAWELGGRPLTTYIVDRPAIIYTAEDQDRKIRAMREDVLGAIGVSQLVDVRAPEEYSGRMVAPAHMPQEQSARPGHIPTAVSVPWSRAANDDGTIKSDEELRAIYAEAGIELDRDIIAYCRIGERSAHTWFILHEILDAPSVRNYDGSWVEYGSLVGVPIQLGEEPGSVQGGGR